MSDFESNLSKASTFLQPFRDSVTGNYINGEMTEPSAGNYLDNIDPSTGEAYSLVPDSDERDMDLAVDAAGSLAYLAPSMANLQVTQDRWPDIKFAATRETLLFAA